MLSIDMRSVDRASTVKIKHLSVPLPVFMDRDRLAFTVLNNVSGIAASTSPRPRTTRSTCEAFFGGTASPWQK